MTQLFDATTIYFEDPHTRWLQPHCGGWQFGESYLLAALNQLVGCFGRATEIGAGDGEMLPVTIEPLYRCGVPCVLYEADKERREKLSRRFPSAEILGQYSIGDIGRVPIHNELLVIDVDSIDSLIMEQELQHRRASIAVLMVEHFDLCCPYMVDEIGRVPAWLLGQQLANDFIIQDTAATLNTMADRSGFTRLAFSRVNSIFVRNDLMPLLKRPILAEQLDG